MKKIFTCIKNAFKGIMWPKPKEVFNDTCFTVISTVVLSILILLWVTGIDIIVDFVISIF